MIGLERTVLRTKQKWSNLGEQKESSTNGGIRKIQCSKNRPTTAILIKMKHQFKNSKIII